jgi:hypothetical protein
VVSLLCTVAPHPSAPPMRPRSASPLLETLATEPVPVSRSSIYHSVFNAHEFLQRPSPLGAVGCWPKYEDELSPASLLLAVVPSQLSRQCFFSAIAGIQALPWKCHNTCETSPIPKMPYGDMAGFCLTVLRKDCVLEIGSRRAFVLWRWWLAPYTLI